MTDLPQWAMEKAHGALIEFLHDDRCGITVRFGMTGETQKATTEAFARALVEAEARGIERAAKVADKYKSHPNTFKAEEPDKTVYGWGRARSEIAATIRKLKTNL